MSEMEMTHRVERWNTCWFRRQVAANSPDTALQRTVDVPQVQYIGEVQDGPATKDRQVPMVQSLPDVMQ